MMSILHPTALTPDFTVSPQIEPTDVAQIARLGFKTIINNRPDDEEPGQPRHAEVEKAAQSVGLTYHHHPVVGGLITPDQVEEMHELLAQAEKPVFAFCRSGARCTALFQMVSERHHR